VKLFVCASCQQVVYFENSQCTRCGHELAYLPERGVLAAIEPAGDDAGVFRALAAGAEGERYRHCGNRIDHAACNWAVSEADDHRFCRACRLNDVIPNLGDAQAKARWLKVEESKRRTLYTLLRLGLPVEPRGEGPEGLGLGFAFKQDMPGEEKVLIGHEDGLITINVAEADSPFREKTRLELGEAYRTLLGHFRHEIGHYYWDRLIKNAAPRLAAFRDRFGDERASYEDAVAAHYRDGARPDWPARYVSSYASMHAWEDWAESWAHYLHMVDTLETARSFGLSLWPRESAAELEVGTRQLHFDDFADLAGAWVPLTVALNALNRSMGLPDPYPFVLSEPALEKIRLVHDVIAQHRAA
jgi:hypothetical protein